MTALILDAPLRKPMSSATQAGCRAALSMGIASGFAAELGKRLRS